MRILTGLFTVFCLPAAWAMPPLSAADLTLVEAGKVVVHPLKPTDDAGVAARATAVVKAPPSDVWPVLRDCEKYKDFMPRTKESEVRHQNGRIRVCYTKVDMPFPFSDLWAEVKSVEKHGSDGSFARSWSLMKGTYRRNNGAWTVKPWGTDGRHSLVEYRIDLDPETNVPDFIIRKAQTSTLPDVFEAIRKRVLALR